MKSVITYDSLPDTTTTISNYESLNPNEIQIWIESKKDDVFASLSITTEEAEHLISAIQSCIDLTRQQNKMEEP